MFETLEAGLQNAIRTLRGKGKLSEANMRDGMKLVERACSRPTLAIRSSKISLPKSPTKRLANEC